MSGFGAEIGKGFMLGINPSPAVSNVDASVLAQNTLQSLSLKGTEGPGWLVLLDAGTTQQQVTSGLNLDPSLLLANFAATHHQTVQTNQGNLWGFDASDILNTAAITQQEIISSLKNGPN
jgi:hypothetical protein